MVANGINNRRNAMRKYAVEITGNTPLLHHWDNIDWADEMSEWKDDPANKSASKAGDDRTPAWRWIGSMYNDGAFVSVPADNLMRSMMEGGAMVPVPGGKSGKTFKSQSQSGMMVDQAFWHVEVGGKRISMDDIRPLLKNTTFREHRAHVEKLGFSLFVKRAKVGTSKHIRVRPRFDQWSISGTVSVWDDQITDHVIKEILKYAGQYKGLGDWRPGGKTSGAFGMFEAKVSKA
jgi:hypothetical protein